MKMALFLALMGRSAHGGGRVLGGDRTDKGVTPKVLLALAGWANVTGVGVVGEGL